MTNIVSDISYKLMHNVTITYQRVVIVIIKCIPSCSDGEIQEHVGFKNSHHRGVLKAFIASNVTTLKFHL